MVVGDDDDGGAAVAGDLAEEFHDLAAALAVEGGGGFVGEEEAGLVGEGAGDGDALLLAAVEGVGEVAGAVADAEVIEEFGGAAAGWAWGDVVDFEGDGDVFEGGEEGDEVGLLEDEAEVLTAVGAEVDEGALAVEDPLSAEGEAAGGGGVDEADGGEEGGFAGAAGAEEGDDFARGEAEGDVVHGDDLGVAGAVDFGEADGLDGWGQWGGGGHARILLGWTDMALAMPARLASREMARTRAARVARSRGSTMTRRGKRGKA